MTDKPVKPKLIVKQPTKEVRIAIAGTFLASRKAAAAKKAAPTKKAAKKSSG